MPNVQTSLSISSLDFEHITAIQVPVVGGSMSLICVDTREDGSNTTKDKGWAWVVCAGSFLIMFFTFGTHTCFGVLLSALLDHFQESRARTGKTPNAIEPFCLLVHVVIPYQTQVQRIDQSEMLVVWLYKYFICSDSFLHMYYIYYIM